MNQWMGYRKLHTSRSRFRAVARLSFTIMSASAGCAYSSSFRHGNDFRFMLSLYFLYAIIYIIYMRRDGYNSGCDGYNFGEYMVIILGTLLYNWGDGYNFGECAKSVFSKKIFFRSLYVRMFLYICGAFGDSRES